MANIYQAGGKAVGKAAQIATRDLKEVAAKVKDQFNMTETVDTVANALKSLWSGNDTVTQTFAQYKKNPNKTFKALQEAGLLDKKELNRAVQQPPRSEKNPDITWEPFEQEAINVSKLPTVYEGQPPVPVMTNYMEPYRYSTAREIPPVRGEEQKRLPPKMIPSSTSQELVPVGRGRTTFIAGEEGISAGGQSPVGPIPVYAEGRTIEERIRARKETPPEPTTPPPSDAVSVTRTGLSKAQKVGAGLAVAGAAGMATRGKEEEPAKLPVYNVNPRITADGKLEPSPAELEEATSRGGYKAVRQLWNTYEDLNKQVSERPLTASRSDVNIKIQRAQDFLSELRSMAPQAKETTRPTSTVPLVLEPGKFAPLLGLKEGPAQPTAPTLKQETANVPPPVRGGGQPARVPTSESDIEKSASQAVKGIVAQKSAMDVQDKISQGQPITRSDIQSLYERIEAIKPQEVSADPALMKQIASAREEARRAYREQATLNQWAEVAQTVGNAVANYVAAMRGVADRALALPNIDYNARTMGALREYQTELSTLSDQERLVERGVERGQRAAEQAAERQQRSLERLAAYGERQLEAADRKAEREKDRATQLQIANIRDTRAITAATNRAQEKANKAATATGKTQASLLDQSIKETDNLIKGLEKKLALATTLANSGSDQKAFDRAFNAYAADKGVTKQAPEFQKEKWFGGTKFDKDQAIAVATTNVDELKQQIANLRQQKADTTARREEILLGGTPAPTPAPAQPAGQKPAAGGKVLSESDLEAYAKSQGTTPAAARNFLLSQGYTIQGK